MGEENVDVTERISQQIAAMDHCVDTYFPPNHDLKEQKLKEFGNQLMSLCAHVKGDQRLSSRALCELCTGKSVDIHDTFSVEAHGHFERAVKLNPRSVDAWNALAESFWKTKDYSMAQVCFCSALNVKQNKVTLRRLSMIVRIIINTKRSPQSASVVHDLENSLKLAKDAVALDIKDGVSWYVMGNAFMGLYFARQTEGDPSDLLRQAIRAYNQAEALLGDTQIPDLHHNRANVYAYLQEHSRALTDLATAHSLDASLGVLERHNGLIAYLKNCDAMLDSRRHDKKISSFVHKLVGAQCSTDSFSSLRVGPNPNAKVTACVVRSTQDFDGLGIVYLVVDRSGVLHLLHVGKVCSSVRSGCVITASRPCVTLVHADAGNQQRIQLQFVCVFDPCANITVDGKPILDSDLVLTEVSICQPNRASVATAI